MKKIIAVCLIVFLAGAGQCFGNALLRENIGAVASGRAGVNIAHTDNNVLIHDNPAALTEVKGRIAEMNLDTLFVNPSFKNAYNNESLGNVICPLPSMSYVQELTDTLGIGAGLFVPAGCQTDYKLYNPIYSPLYGSQEYSSFIAFQKLLVALGWEPIESLSIGAGIGGAYNKMKMKEVYTFQGGAFAGFPVLLDMKADDIGFTWNLGLQWRVTDRTTVGLSYQPEHEFSMEGDAEVTLGPGAAMTPYDVAFDFTWPQTIGGGIAHQLTDAIKISADVKWFDWSSAFDKITFNLSNASGSSQDTLPLEWEDTYSVALGLDYDITSKDTIRLGYVREENPIPADTQNPLIPAVLAHQVHLGYGHDWENLSLNLAYAYAWGDQDAGDSKLHAIDHPILGLPGAVDEYDNSSIELAIHVVSMGVQYRF